MLGSELGVDHLDFDVDFGEETLQPRDRSFESGVLLIGCSGMRASLEEELSVLSDQYTVYQCLANTITTSSSGWRSSLNYAIDGQGYENIVICGHEDCNFIQDTLKVTEEGNFDGPEQSLIRLRETFRQELLDLSNNKLRADRLAKLNVLYQVQHLTERIEKVGLGVSGSELSVHGWFWSSTQDNFLDLNVTRRVER
ncbi:MAG: carbonic anhydrase [bacterium]